MNNFINVSIVLVFTSSFYKENNFKPCLTKQLLNMFKLWCERGINQTISKPFKWKWFPPTTAHRFIFMQIKLIFALRLVLNTGTKQHGNGVYRWVRVGSCSCVKFVPYWVARDIHDQGFESNNPPSRRRGALLRLLTALSRKYKPYENNKQCCESCDLSIAPLLKANGIVEEHLYGNKVFHSFIHLYHAWRRTRQQ